MVARSPRRLASAFALVLVTGAFAFVALAACGALLGSDEDPSGGGGGGNADGSNPNGDGATTANGGGDGSSTDSSDGGVGSTDAEAGIPCGSFTCKPSVEQCCWSPTGNPWPLCVARGAQCPNGSVPLECAYGVGCSSGGGCCVGYGSDGGPLGTNCQCALSSGGTWSALCGPSTFCQPAFYSCETADAYPPEYGTCQKPFQ